MINEKYLLNIITINYEEEVESNLRYYNNKNEIKDFLDLTSVITFLADFTIYEVLGKNEVKELKELKELKNEIIEELEEL